MSENYSEIQIHQHHDYNNQTSMISNHSATTSEMWTDVNHSSVDSPSWNIFLLWADMQQSVINFSPGLSSLFIRFPIVNPQLSNSNSSLSPRVNDQYENINIDKCHSGVRTNMGMSLILK